MEEIERKKIDIEKKKKNPIKFIKQKNGGMKKKNSVR